MVQYGEPDFNELLDKTTKERLRTLKETYCEDCKIEYPPEIMCFHHRDPARKSFTINSGVGIYDWEEIYQETEKCDILCSNCHGLRHIKMRQLAKTHP